MSQWDFAVNFFIALFALIDPVGNVPLFAAAIGGARARGRRLLALYIALFVLAFLAFFYVSGLSLLAFFGISLPAFRIAGGVILFLLGLEMAREDFTAKFAELANGEEDGRGFARRRFEGLIVPFGMPLLIGPGAISTVIIYASEARPLGWTGAAISLGVIVAVSACVFLAFASSHLINRLLGRIGTSITVRVLGLILCAMAVQFVMIGIADSTTGVIRPEAAAPYAH
jgi:multiple antibiotic resistance protein